MQILPCFSNVAFLMSIQPNALGGARPELWHKNMNIDGEVDLEESVEV